MYQYSYPESINTSHTKLMKNSYPDSFMLETKHLYQVQYVLSNELTVQGSIFIQIKWCHRFPSTCPIHPLLEVRSSRPLLDTAAAPAASSPLPWVEGQGQLGFRSPYKREGGCTRRSSTATGEEKRQGYGRRCLVVEKRRGSSRRRLSAAIPPRWLLRIDWRGDVLGEEERNRVCVGLRLSSPERPESAGDRGGAVGI